jgi:hypothetical protein
VPVVKHFFALCLFKQDVTATSSSAAAPSSPRLGRNFFKDGLLNSPCAADAVTGINIVAASATTKAVSLALVEEEEDVTVAVDVGRARFLAPTGLGAAWGEGVHSSSELKSLCQRRAPRVLAVIPVQRTRDRSRGPQVLG